MPQRRWWIGCALALGLLAEAGPAAAVLPAPVARALQAAGIAPHQVGLRVELLGAAEARALPGGAAPVEAGLFAAPGPADGAAPSGPAAGGQAAPDDRVPAAAFASHRADVALNPASTMKLLTTQAALELLGAGYRWRTEWLAVGRMVEGTLRGDLVLRGGGDPKLVIEDLAEQVALLRAGGLQAIRGDLVLDDSLWSVAREAEAFDGDVSQPYNVWPNAAMMNFKAVRVTVEPGAAPASPAAVVLLDPPLAGVPVENDVVLTPGACRAAAVPLSVRDSGRDDLPAGIRVGGRWPAACGTQSASAAVLTHRQFAQALFRAAWEATGGQWQGAARWGETPPRARPLLQWQSPRTLADVVRDVNKFSNNLMARSLLLQIGVERAGVPGTADSGARAVRQWLQRAGLPMPELVIENGAGLSRRERMSAASMVALLRRAAAGEHGARLAESLPVVGVDGTMARRLRGEPVAGSAWIKSGSLAEVRSVAGYLAARSGRRYALAMMVNGPRAEQASEAIDALLRWLHANG